MNNGGIPYFPLDCQLDEKFELIEAEFGLTGFAIVVKLFQRIYGGQGYYCEWTNEVALLFGKKNMLGGNVVSEIVRASVKRGIFDENIFEKYQVLTSKGIQERYFEAVSRRKNVKVKNEYLLLKCDQIPKNVDISSENVCNNSKNVDISKQSKVEKRIEKDRRVEDVSAKNADTNGDNDDNNSLKALKGIGKGVVMLTEAQEESLLEKLDIDGFNFYVEKLADFIINKNAKVKSHYQTILKWHSEDSKA